MGFLLRTIFSEVVDQSFMLSSFTFVYFPIILNSAKGTVGAND